VSKVHREIAKEDRPMEEKERNVFPPTTAGSTGKGLNAENFGQ